MSKQHNRSIDVLVIGAGLAGLSAARELQKAGKSVHLIEARDRVGGRTWTKKLSDNVHIDLGAQWIGPTQTEMYALCDEFNLQTYPTCCHGDEFMTFDGNTVRYPSSSNATAPSDTHSQTRFFRIIKRLAKLGNQFVNTAVTELNIKKAVHELSQPIIDKCNQIDYDLATKRLQSLADTIDTHAPWQHPQATKLDKQTFEDWINANIFTSECKAFFHLFSRSTLTSEASEISLLHILFYIKSSGGIDRLIDTEDGAQQDLIVGGTQQISDCLANAIGWEHITLNSPVKQISQDDHGVTVTTSEKRFVAKQVIVAIPPNIADRITYSPPLPQKRQALTEQIAMGKVIKVVAVYDHPFWRDHNLNGQIVCLDGWVQITFDSSPEEGNAGVLTGFIEGAHVEKALNLLPEARKALVLDCFERYFGEQARTPVDYFETKWGDEPYTQGGYTCHFKPNMWTQCGEMLRKPIGKIYWAGAETATEWCGFMEGAVRSGKTAAHMIMSDTNTSVNIHHHEEQSVQHYSFA